MRLTIEARLVDDDPTHLNSYPLAALTIGRVCEPSWYLFRNEFSLQRVTFTDGPQNYPSPDADSASCAAVWSLHPDICGVLWIAISFCGNRTFAMRVGDPRLLVAMAHIFGPDLERAHQNLERGGDVSPRLSPRSPGCSWIRFLSR